MLYLFSMILGILSARYPSYKDRSAIELITGLLFGLAAFFLSRYAKHAFLIPVCLFAAAADLRTGEIPDLCSVLILIYAISCKAFDPGCFIILFVTTVLSINEWLGWGDAKILTAWSVLFGLNTWKAVSAASFAALPFALTKRKTGHIVFAPFLCIGFLFCLISE